MYGMEKDAYQAVRFRRKWKDYYRWSRLFLSYTVIRKYRDVLVGETHVLDFKDAAAKAENDPQAKAKHVDILVRSQKAKSELLTAV